MNIYTLIETRYFNHKQMADREKKFEYFKGIANKYYYELAALDKNNAYDYQKLKMTVNYPKK